MIVGGWGREERYVVDVGARLPLREARSSASSDREPRLRRPRELSPEVHGRWPRRGLVSGSRADRRLRRSGGDVDVVAPDGLVPARGGGTARQVHARRRGRLANAQAREELARSGRRAGAVSRVAVAAATESTERLFDIVSEEVDGSFGARWASTSRYAEDGTNIVIMGNWGG